MDAFDSVVSEAAKRMEAAELVFHAHLYQMEVWKESGLQPDLEAARICLGAAMRLDPGMVFMFVLSE